MSYAKICPRRSTKTKWELDNPILLSGEMGIENPDTGTGTGLVKIKFGDGITPWNDLPYGLDSESARAIYGGTVTTSCDIWIRTGTTAEWEAEDPILGIGEIVFDITAESIKVGDGAKHFTELDYIGANGNNDFDFGDEDAII